MTEHQISQLIGLLIILYLAGLLYVAHHLKLKHAEVWNSLGSPSLLNWSIKSSFRLGGYVFFSGAHSRLNDRQLTISIYLLRLLVVITIALIAWWRLKMY